jgi:hypothetical protein
MSNDKHWFITDRAIDDPSHDAFAHDDVAGQLVAIVKSITPPATIGLLGGFGTGKSSIGNLLAKKLAGHATLQVVTLSIEKHSETARQRALVYSFAEALGEDAGVNDKSIGKVLGRVEESEGIEGPELVTLPLIEFARTNKIALRNASAWGLLFALALYVVGFIGAWLSRVAGVTDENPFVLPIKSAYLTFPVAIGLFAGFTALFAQWGKESLTPRRSSRTRPRAEAADELERVFADLVRLVKKQLVIVVDDIDRLAPNEVLAALLTIKTLQAVPKEHPPIFILACDDGVLRRAIQDADPGLSTVAGSERIAAEEYLNKLFAVRQPLPPHLKEDMQLYALRLLNSPEASHAAPGALGDSLRGVLEILIHDGVGDPRHVIRLMNAFFADYRLAKVREASGGRLGVGEVTRNPITLARLTVLRVDFPRYYEAIRNEFELLRALDRHVVDGELDEPQRRLLDAAALLSDETGSDTEPDIPTWGFPPPLTDFLRRTVRYAERDVPLAPFFYLGQTAAGRVLGSEGAEAIRRALENNDVEALRLRLSDEAAVAAAAVDHVKATLNNARPGLPLTNAIATAAAVLSFTPESRRTELANEIASLIAREHESVPHPRELADVIRHADPSHSYGLIDRLADFEDDAELARQRAVAVLSLAAERSSDLALIRGVDNYFKSLADNTGWQDVREWLPMIEAIEPAIRSKVIGDSFFAAVIHAVVGVADDGIEVGDADSLCSLLDAAPLPVRASHSVVEAVRDCGTAAAREPRWLAVRVLEHLAPNDDGIRLFLPVLAEISSNDDVESYDETLAASMDILAGWATGRQPALASLPMETVEAVLAAVAATVKSTTAEVAQAGAGAAQAVAAVWPTHIQLVVSAMAEQLDAHRDLEDATGQAIHQAFLAMVPTAVSETLAKISLALFGPLTSADNEADPGTRLAIESVMPVASSTTGREMIVALVPAWRQRYSAAVANANELRPQTLALSAAAQSAALPEPEEQSLWDRLRTLPSLGPPMPEVAAVALAAIRWEPQRRNGATETIADVWEQLGDAVRSEIVGRVGGWPPAEAELSPRFSELATSHALQHEDDNTKAAWFNNLWPGLQTTDRARALAEGIGDVLSLRDKVATLKIDELIEALRRANSTPNFATLVEAAKTCPESVRSEAAKRFILGSFDDADFGWNDQSVQAAVDLLSPTQASETVETATPSLSSGATTAGHAASLLGWIRQTHPKAVASADEEIESAIKELLPQASPDLAGRLGAASRGIPWNRFDGTLKGMRKRHDEQVAREAANAFESGRGTR